MILFVFAALADPVDSWNLQQDDGGLVPAASDIQWAWGAPSVGPASGATGTRAWGTGLHGPYLNDAVGRLRLPPRPLAGISEPMLVFAHWSDIADGDAAWVEAFDGTTWSVLEPPYGYPSSEGFTGSTLGWDTAFFDLGGLDDLSDVRLVFSADASVQGVGWFIDDLELWDGDIVPPRIATLSGPTDTEELDGPYTVEAAIEDDHTVVEAFVFWETAKASGFEPLLESGGTWAGGIPGQEPDTDVTWWIEASDGVNVADTDTETFRVRLPAPTDLAGLDGRIVDVEAALTWSAPASSHVIEGYVVERLGETVAEVEDSEATVEVLGDGEDEFAVRALFDVGLGDASDPVELDVVRPQLISVEPDSGYQSDTLTVRLEGEYLLLVEDDVDVGLGEGVDVLEVFVVDVDRLELTVAVDEDAAEGFRDLLVRTGDVVLPLEDAFEVVNGAGRPALVSVRPDAVRQGDVTTLVITSSTEIDAEEVLLDLGDGIVIEEIRVEDDCVEADIVVEPTAPLGTRPITVDDGERVFEGVELRVRDALPVTEGTCSHAPVNGLGLLGLLLGLLVRRR
ncbi:MAG: hypothetical protein GY913_17960 [Proteobacteria bacterium]|nr:hypothetical protein [Pseudomonadota bacterium]MCP4918793.1 hypothetical protein [Pseudomonadota bacterium]